MLGGAGPVAPITKPLAKNHSFTASHLVKLKKAVFSPGKYFGCNFTSPLLRQL
jgi:hypothetical protein